MAWTARQEIAGRLACFLIFVSGLGVYLNTGLPVILRALGLAPICAAFFLSSYVSLKRGRLRLWRSLAGYLLILALLAALLASQGPPKYARSKQHEASGMIKDLTHRVWNTEEKIETAMRGEENFPVEYRYWDPSGEFPPHWAPEQFVADWFRDHGYGYHEPGHDYWSPEAEYWFTLHDWYVERGGAVAEWYDGMLRVAYQEIVYYNGREVLVPSWVAGQIQTLLELRQQLRVWELRLEYWEAVSRPVWAGRRR